MVHAIEIDRDVIVRPEPNLKGIQTRHDGSLRNRVEHDLTGIQHHVPLRRWIQWNFRERAFSDDAAVQTAFVHPVQFLDVQQRVHRRVKSGG